MQEYERQIVVSGYISSSLQTLKVSRLRSVWLASITPWTNSEQCFSFTDVEELKMTELNVRFVHLNDRDFLERVQLVARATQGIDFRYVDPLTPGESSADSPPNEKKRSKKCEGQAVNRCGDGTVLTILPVCEAVPDVRTHDNRWLCLDCAAYHFGGWSESDAEQWVARHREDIGFDPDEESNAQAVAYLNR